MKKLLMFALGFFAVTQSDLFCAKAHAGLGEQESTIENDRRAITGEIRTATNHGSYIVYEIVSQARKLREYVTTEGVVFGIAWQGLNHPDLSSLLGSYYGEIKKATLSGARGRFRRSNDRLRSAHAIVERSGHMRDFRGRAFVQSLLPEGVSANEIL